MRFRVFPERGGGFPDNASRWLLPERGHCGRQLVVSTDGFGNEPVSGPCVWIHDPCVPETAVGARYNNGLVAVGIQLAGEVVGCRLNADESVAGVERLISHDCGDDQGQCDAVCGSVVVASDCDMLPTYA